MMSQGLLTHPLGKSKGNLEDMVRHHKDILKTPWYLYGEIIWEPWRDLQDYLKHLEAT